MMEECMKVGQWGGVAGSYWSFKANKGGISEIIIIHGEAIDSISFKSEDGDGAFEYSDKYGGDGGDRTDKRVPDNLTSITGTTGNVWNYTVIKSLRFYSNRSKYGPYGVERGESFSFPMEGGVIVGFHGRSGALLDAIGVYVKTFIPSCALSPVTMQKIMEENLKVGPWGGEDGKNSWSFKANKGGISEIVIMQGWAIDAISFKSDDRSGTFQYSDKFGGNGGKTEKIMIDWPREYLTSIIGTYQSVWPFGPVVIKSLRIITNVTKYGPYGYEFGTPFSFLAEGGEIVGFHGRSECFVNSIGVYVKSLIPFCASNPDYTMQQELDDNTMNVVVPRGVGPWGGNGGKQWDDGVFSSIHELHLHVGDSAVHAIQLFYESSEGKIVRSQKHGGTGGDQIHKIKLDASTEFLVGIMGFYGPVKGNDDYEALRSITLYTNNGRYGPFGEEIGTSFTSSASRGKVVGFHGRSGIYLDAIGIHMEYF